MTDEKDSSANPPGENPPPVEAAKTPFTAAYAGASEAATDDGGAQVRLCGDVHRDPVRFDGVLRDPLAFREGLSALYAIVGSDLRYVPKDRSAFLAYQRLRKESAGMNAWQAQQQYYAWLQRNDPRAAMILDPVVSVHPDRVFIEVFSKDESSYGSLSVALDAFEHGTQPSFGTTNIDFSEGLFHGIQQIRTYRPARLRIAPDAVSLSAPRGELLEKRIQVPDAWLRGFLQVQSAAALARDVVKLAPIDLYNLLRQLRLHADQKGKRRALRFELVPGEPPRAVLEPWNEVYTLSGEPFTGKTARVVRIWGRRRLSLVRRFLPFAERIEVHLLGQGLASFWVLHGPQATLTLGLTGFTAANWSQAVNFDLLLPRRLESPPELERIVRFLADRWFATQAAIGKATNLAGPALGEALQQGCQQGKLMYDPAFGVYRLRPLADAPLDLGKLLYRNDRERQAYDLVKRKGAVKLAGENRIHGVGLEVTGRVAVAEDQREYRPQMLLTDEGAVSRAECTCPTYRRDGMKLGPCSCLIALRLAYGAEEAKRIAGGKGRQSVTAETRTYLRRTSKGEEERQLTLDRSRVRVRSVHPGGEERIQNMRFASVDDARDAYFEQVDALASRGFLDATQG